MLLKAGTYRFNDVLSMPDLTGVDDELTIFDLEFNFTVNAIIEGNSYVAYGSRLKLELLENTFALIYSINYTEPSSITNPSAFGVYDTTGILGFDGWNTGIGDEIRNITITSDIDVSDQYLGDIMGAWVIANTNYNEVNPTEDKEYIEKSSWYKSVADAIRNKKGTSAPILRDDFASEIEAISGGAEFNIAYGETEPTDISKIWAKTTEPSKVSFRNVFSGASYGAEFAEATAVLPEGLYQGACGAVGTDVYYFGGFGSSRSDKIYKYDTITDTITTVTTTLPTALYNLGCGVVGTDIYLFGGYTTSRRSGIYKYDTVNDTITTLSFSLPSALENMGCGVVGTSIYLFGGLSGTTNSGERTKKIYKCDTLNNYITTISTTLPVALEGARCGVVGTDIYVLGGYSSNGATNTIYKLDTITDTISTLEATLPVNIFNGACTSVGTDVYYFGGSTPYASMKICKYNSLTDVATELTIALPMAIQSPSCGAVGTEIYVMGGIYATTKQDTIYKFNAQYTLPYNELQFIEAYNRNTLPIISSDTADINISFSNAFKGNSQNKAESVEIYTHNGDSWERYC